MRDFLSPCMSPALALISLIAFLLPPLSLPICKCDELPAGYLEIYYPC